MKYNEIVREAPKNPQDKSQAYSELVNIMKTPDIETWQDFTPEQFQRVKELIKITGRTVKVPNYGSTGAILDRMTRAQREKQIAQGQMPDFTGVAATTSDMAQQISQQTNGKYEKKQGRVWTTSTGARYRDPQDFINYPDQESFDDAMEWVSARGVKIRYRDSSGTIHSALKIGNYVVEPATVVYGAFTDSPVTKYSLSVRKSATLSKGSRQKLDITDQQAAALKDIADTRTDNAIQGIKDIMAVLQGEQDVKRIIDRSRKIDPRDKAKLDAIIAGASNFQEPL